MRSWHCQFIVTAIHVSYSLFFCVQLLVRLGIILLAACIANYWAVFPAAIFVSLVVALRWYYLKSSREVKRLESIG